MKNVRGRSNIWLFCFVLTCSLGFNVYLWLQLKRSDSDYQDVIRKDIDTISISSSSVAKPNARFASTPDELEKNLQSNSLDAAEPISIAQLYDYLREENWPLLTVNVRTFLRQQPDNIEAQLIEAELIARTEPLAIALVHYYSLLDLELDSEQRGNIVQKIEQLFENATEQLRFDRAWDLLAELLEPLVQIAPDERRYLILLAEAYAQQINVVMMENALAGLASDDPAITSIRSILARKLEREGDANDKDALVTNSAGRSLPETNITRIQLDRLGNQYTVDTGIDGRPVRLMIDTGASTTAITSRVWGRLSQRIASQFIGIFKVNTAAGYIEAPMFKVKRFTLGSLSFDDVSVMVIPSRMMGDDPRISPQGLLGMNILSNFNFQIDQQSAQLLLSRRAK